MRVLRVANLVGCKDFLSPHELSSHIHHTQRKLKRSVFSVCRRPSVGQRPLPLPLPQREGRDHRDTPMRKRPLPLPLPRREGRNHRDTPMANHQHLTTITQHPSLAVTFCELCMPKAFCGIETVRKKIRELCEFCER